MECDGGDPSEPNAPLSPIHRHGGAADPDLGTVATRIRFPRRARSDDIAGGLGRVQRARDSARIMAVAAASFAAASVASSVESEDGDGGADSPAVPVAQLEALPGSVPEGAGCDTP